MSDDLAAGEAELLKRTVAIIEAARGRVARTVNTAMVHAYWMIGREIVEVEQAGEHRRGPRILRDRSSARALVEP